MHSKTWALLLLPLCLALVIGCGGNAGTKANFGSGGGSSSGGGGGVGGGGGGGGGGSVAAPVTINVNGGQATTNMDITVAAPVSSPTPNTLAIGVGDSVSSIVAFNIGATIPKGTTKSVLLFGPGLSANMQVVITGPSDITISNLQSETATDGTPGLSFTATVSSSAALGARTVILQDTNDDITTFTGGLEVTP